MIILYIVLTILLSSFLFIYMCRRERGLNDGRIKKIYIVLTVVLSSFILLSGREVKADTYTQEIDLSFISSNSFYQDAYQQSDYFYRLKEATESLLFSEGLSGYYIIIANSSGTLSSYIFENNDWISRRYLEVTSSYTRLYHNPGFSYKYVRYNSNLDSFSLSSGFSSSTSFKFDLTNILVFTNIDLYINSSNSIIYTLGEDSWVTTSESEEKFFTLYDIYQDYYSISRPEPVDNTPELTTFYTLVLTKIVYFCNYMASNTLFLTMLVIIIIIFIFELIFRRRL